MYVKTAQIPIPFLTPYLDGADKGIIPLTCEELFARVEQMTAEDSDLSISVEVSYIEVLDKCTVPPSLLNN